MTDRAKAMQKLLKTNAHAFFQNPMVVNIVLKTSSVFLRSTRSLPRKCYDSIMSSMEAENATT